MSYNEVAELIERNTGEEILSSQSIDNLVEKQSKKIAQANRIKYSEHLNQGKLKIEFESPDIYSSESKELEIYADGIQVKKQKPNRESRKVDGEKTADNKGQNLNKAKQETAATTTNCQPPQDKEKRKRINTDLVIIKKPDGFYQHIMEHQAEGLSLEEITIAEINRFYGAIKDKQKIVVIADGAQTIRVFIRKLFGDMVFLILDWYHLQKKLWEMITTVKITKEKKLEYVEQILSLLWEGKTDEALDYIRQTIKPISLEKSLMLIRYIKKHQSEIINYKLRQSIGKPIGSGRMENTVNQVIGRRQKSKGISWSTDGSRSLAIIEITIRNNDWTQKWPDLLMAS